MGVKDIPRTIVNEVTNCDSFLIPSDIYKYKDSLSDIE